MNRSPRFPGFSKTPLAALLCVMGPLLFAGGAQAQLVVPESLDSPLRPYYVRVSQTFSYDSNLFRTSENEESDLISSTALVGGFEQRVGRQHLYGSAGVSGNLYQDNDQLNGIGYDLLGGIRWEIGSILSGNARVRASQAQASFSDYGTFETNRTDRNRERATVIDFNALYGRGVLGFEVLANRTDVSYSRSGFSDRDRESNMVGAGLRFRPGGPWTFGLTARFTDGEYPDAVDLTTGQVVPDEYERRDIDLSAQYQASGFSVLSARISHTDEEHDLVTARDFDGLTGAINWHFQATGKTRLALSLSRTTGTGAGSGLFAFESSDPLSPTPTGPESVSFLTDSRRSDTLSVVANWRATSKIAVEAGVKYSRDRYDTRFVEQTGEDSSSSGNSYTMSLAADYYITRAWSATCGVGYERRETDFSTARGSFDYDATTVFCGAALQLR